MSLRGWIALTSTGVLVSLGGCATAPQGQQEITMAEPQPMQQAPQRTPQQDVRTPLPPPVAEPITSPSIQQTGSYVRIDTGWSFSQNAGFRDDAAVSPTCFIAVSYPGGCGAELNHAGSSPVFGVTAGYHIRPGLRADVSVARRSGYELKGSDPEGTLFDPKITSDSIMANVYFDLPFNWIGMKPFIGGGIGYGHNKMDPIKWRDATSSGVLPGGSSSGFVWQLSLGADIPLSATWALEIGYRYMDLGKIKKDAGPDIDGQFNPPPNGTGSATGSLRANELMVGFRYTF